MRATPLLLAMTIAASACSGPTQDSPDAGRVDDDISYSEFDVRRQRQPDLGADAEGVDDGGDLFDAMAPLDVGSDSTADASEDVGPMIMPGVDTDGDGLDDVWEDAAGDIRRLDWQSADSDGNGVPDGAEDYDGDGLTNLVEYQISQRPASSGNAPNPFRRDLLVELDEMTGRSLSAAVLVATAAVFADLADPVGLLIYRDENGIAAFDFDGSFAQRHAFFETHGPTFGATPAPLPTGEMIHVAAVSRRTDDMFRGAEVVTEGAGMIESTGLLVYVDALVDLHPQCGLNGNPPDITIEEALASALAHELGHVLQLGHDTTAGGGINYFNVMSVPTTCTEAQQRFHGLGNADGNLGATDASGASRFSAAAEALMQFDQRLSVDTSELTNGGQGTSM